MDNKEYTNEDGKLAIVTPNKEVLSLEELTAQKESVESQISEEERGFSERIKALKENLENINALIIKATELGIVKTEVPNQ